IIAVELGFRLGAELGFETLGDIWAEVERLSPIHQGISHELLGRPEFRDGVVAPMEVEEDAPEPAGEVEAPGVVVDEERADRAEDQSEELQREGQVGGYPESTPESSEAAVDQDFMAPDALTYRPVAVAPTTPPPDAYALRLVTS